MPVKKATINKIMVEEYKKRRRRFEVQAHLIAATYNNP